MKSIEMENKKNLLEMENSQNEQLLQAEDERVDLLETKSKHLELHISHINDQLRGAETSSNAAAGTAKVLRITLCLLLVFNLIDYFLLYFI